MSPALPEPGVLRDRAQILRALRGWLDDNGFVEIEAPTLVRSGALEEHLEALAVGDRFLHTSPEFACKRVLASGLPRLYSLGPCYRGEEWGPMHSTEFTMLEWYRVGTDYRGILDDTRELVRAAASAVGVDVPPFEQLTAAEALARHSPGAEDVERAWVNDVEPRLLSPTFIVDYPAADAAFAEVRGDIAERFELYWKGIEVANAFTELRDPVELRARWEHNNAARRAAGRLPHPVDERVVDAVSRHARAGGIALGVDRLVLVLLGLSDIAQVRIPG
ncbi:MAG: EF-P lysine aminoacylase GenX [Proteobacteria bacterium]|nr:EF-P lysine aminoacylase GenX [Pseudomonadota bacterium]MCP4920227.1 EF-P lysine aminoacylase GenX [Pseudomonadota bacterium]